MITGLVGNIGAGIIQINGAINGDLAGAEAGANGMAAASSLSGFAAYVYTGGNVDAAASAAQIEGIILTPAAAGAGEMPSASDVADTTQNAYDLVRGSGSNSDMAAGKCQKTCP